MRVQTWGDVGDPVILLLAGDGEPADRWDTQSCQRLAAGPRFVLRYDTGGPDTDSGSAEDQVAQVLRALDGYQVARAYVTAGPLAARLAGLHPDRVELVGPLRTDEDRPDWDGYPTVLLRQSSGGWDEQGDRLAARWIAAGDATGWFDRLYSAGFTGEVDMPWDRDDPHPILARWAADSGVQGNGALGGNGRRAVVCGCGLGADAEFLARLGYRTVGFDVAPTAVRVAQDRHPESTVDYQVADLLRLPAPWLRSFDLVVDVFTVQALPDPPRRTAIVNVGRLVAPGGTLVVVALRGDRTGAVGPPWPLRPDEIDAFGTDGLEPVRVAELTDPRWQPGARWLAEFRRPG